MATKPKRPRDPNQLAKLIVDVATGEAEDPSVDVNQAVAESKRKGGLKGGKARMEALSEAEKKALAQKAAAIRWHKAAASKKPTAAKSTSVKKP